MISVEIPSLGREEYLLTLSGQGGKLSSSKAFYSAYQPCPLQDSLAEAQVQDGRETSLLSALRFHCLQQRWFWELTCLQVTRIRDKCHVKSTDLSHGTWRSPEGLWQFWILGAELSRSSFLHLAQPISFLALKSLLLPVFKRWVTVYWSLVLLWVSRHFTMSLCSQLLPLTLPETLWDSRKDISRHLWTSYRHHSAWLQAGTWKNIWASG